MFEKHIYSGGFFNFIKDVCKSLQLPEMIQSTFYIIHPEHSTLTQEVKENLFNLIQILSRLVFYLLAKSEENNVLITFYSLIKFVYR